MKSLYSLLVIALSLLLSPAISAGGAAEETKSANDLRDSIVRALDYQCAHYPASQYRDVYKNFMQDFYGPGHILADTAAAGRYLRSELSEEEPFCGPLYEPTGFRGNFYRVNLSLIRDNIVPYDVYFEAFVSSVQNITPPAPEEWLRIWALIDSVIIESGRCFPDEVSDRRELSEQFERGNFVMHHSSRFNEASRFHYRIISRENFDSLIRPYLANSDSD